MKTAFLTLASAAFACFATVAHADDLKLPGSTLGDQADAGDQPVENPENVLGPVMSPECPYIGWSLADLLVFARANSPSLYRQALAIRRAGAPQAFTRDWLENELCMEWEASL